MLKRLIPALLLSLLPLMYIAGQTAAPEISYTGKPRRLIISSINVTGDLNNDPKILAGLSGLKEGQEITIPGEEITQAIKKYWEYGLFSDVKIFATKIEGRSVDLEIYLQERPRLSEINYTGLKKSERDAIDEKVAMMKGSQVTSYLVDRAERYIKDYFVDKGFLNTEVTIVQRDDTSKVNHVFLDINVDKKTKVKVNKLTFEGNEVFSYGKLNRYTKKTNERNLIRNFFRTKKFVEELYREDLARIVEKYNEKGYRDAYIVHDSISHNPDNSVDVLIRVSEGRKYYFGDISWVGNSIYPGEYLTYALRINKGDVFNQTLLDKRLFEEDDAVHNLYMNNGYLFSRIIPVDIRIDGDTVDLEMRIFEGEQAEIDNIIILGNTKTNEHVVRRELRVKPGQLFDKSAIIRSVRELAALQHFDPEKINPVPMPDPDKGTVDIELNLEEKANDQVELSGGFGGGMFIGSLGLKFSNFSIRNIFNKSAWMPLPAGDGQTLALRAQTQGRYFQSYSVQFVEPWLGGKRPNSLSITGYYSVQTGVNQNYYNSMMNNYGYYGGYGYGYDGYGSNSMSKNYYDEDKYMRVLGLSIGFGKRLSWPDDFFQMYTEASIQRYNMKNYALLSPDFPDGKANSLSFRLMFSRVSIDNPLYTRQGSDISLGVEFTPPYSLISGKDFSNATPQERYKLIEFHKWTFKGSMFKSLDAAQKLVFMTRMEYGFIGYYNKYKRTPFGKYELGGDGMSGYSYNASEMIGMRGYENGSLTVLSPVYSNGTSLGLNYNGNIYSKLTAELRYPLTLQPSASVWALGFVEAGNTWADFRTFNPFDLKRAAGVGVRIVLPMFGLMGIDWGYGFDTPHTQDGSGGGGNFRFIMGKEF
ncbi:MAG: outer membrane protein assembly factor BamA [Cytophagaceae bacterium]|jgi:outer membrane protein insertion porin family|nr:outer membrane protein assembly factor BamA [Cytophagaceae bacterium]